MVVNGLSSQERVISHGVPQGSVLGPLLFLVMMNDVSYNIDGGVVCYADDTTLICKSQNFENLNDAMKRSLDSAEDWFRANYFLLNRDKTQTIVFTLKHVATNSEPVKLLGITLDSKLTWSSHISGVCSKLSRIMCLLRNLSYLVTKPYLKQAYSAFFQGTILYGLRLWGGAADVSRVLLWQKKAIRLLAGADYLAHSKPLFINEAIMTVYSLYVFLLLLSAKKCQGTLVSRKDVHCHNTRNKNKFDVPYVRLKVVQSNQEVTRLKLFNHLPTEARNQSQKTFQTSVRNLLLAHPLFSVQEFYKIPSNIVSSFFKT